MLYSPLPMYAKNSRAGKCQFPLPPKSSRDLVPRSGLCLPPRTVSFASADRIRLTTNSVSFFFRCLFGLSPSHSLRPASLSTSPHPPQRPVLSQYWVLPLVSSSHICACVWALLDWQGLCQCPWPQPAWALHRAVFRVCCFSEFSKVSQSSLLGNKPSQMS